MCTVLISTCHSSYFRMTARLNSIVEQRSHRNQFAVVQCYVLYFVLLIFVDSFNISTVHAVSKL